MTPRKNRKPQKLKPIQQAIYDSFVRQIRIEEEMSPEEREAFEQWQRDHLDGHSVTTSDWPGWKKYLQ
jgi:hypothetical protein